MLLDPDGPANAAVEPRGHLANVPGPQPVLIAPSRAGLTGTDRFARNGCRHARPAPHAVQYRRHYHPLVSGRGQAPGETLTASHHPSAQPPRNDGRGGEPNRVDDVRPG
jgi:hypothetical protein